MDTVTKTQALEARKILKQYERQRKEEKRARQCALPCTALVHAYIKRMNDGYGYDAWDADAQKLYRAVKSAEQSALNRRRKGIVEAGEVLPTPLDSADEERAPGRRHGIPQGVRAH